MRRTIYGLGILGLIGVILQAATSGEMWVAGMLWLAGLCLLAGRDSDVRS